MTTVYEMYIRLEIIMSLTDSKIRVASFKFLFTFVSKKDYFSYCCISQKKLYFAIVYKKFCLFLNLLLSKSTAK